MWREHYIMIITNWRCDLKRNWTHHCRRCGFYVWAPTFKLSWVLHLRAGIIIVYGLMQIKSSRLQHRGDKLFMPKAIRVPAENNKVVIFFTRILWGADGRSNQTHMPNTFYFLFCLTALFLSGRRFSCSRTSLRFLYISVRNNRINIMLFLCWHVLCTAAWSINCWHGMWLFLIIFFALTECRRVIKNSKLWVTINNQVICIK